MNQDHETDLQSLSDAQATESEMTTAVPPPPPPDPPASKSRRGLWILLIGLLVIAGMAAAAAYFTGQRQQQERSHLLTAQIAIENDAWATAVTEIDQMLALEPAFLRRHDAEGQGLRGIARYHQGNLNPALADMNAALTADPNLIDLYAYRADIHFQKEEFDAALADTAVALDHDSLLTPPFQARLYANLALIHQAQQEPEAALTAVESALTLAEHQPDDRFLELALLQIELQKEIDETAALESIQALHGLDLSLTPAQMAMLLWPQFEELIAAGQLDKASALSEALLPLADELTDPQLATLYLVRAEAAAKNGDLETGMTEAALAIQYDHPLALPDALTAWIMYTDGNVEMAADAAQTVLDMTESDPYSQQLAHRTLAAVASRQLDHHQTVAEAEAALALDPGDIEALALLTMGKLGIGDYSGAETAAAQAAEIDPEAPASLWAQALIAANQNDQEYAVALMDQAIAQDDGRPEFYLVRADNYRLTSELDLVLADIEKAAALAPEHPWVLSAEHWYTYSLFEYGDGLDTAVLGQHLVENFPQSDIGYSMLAFYHLRFSENYEKALEKINEALSLYPDVAYHYILRGDIYAAQENYEAAQAEYETALSLNPYAIGAVMGQADIAWFEDDLETVQVLYEQLAAQYPYNLTSRTELANVLFERGEKEAAWDLVHEVLTQDPNFDRALIYRASMLGQEGNFDEALSDVDKVLNLFPNFAFGHLNKAQWLYESDDVSAARESAEQALALNPNDPRPYSLLFFIAADEGDWEAAEAYLTLWESETPSVWQDHELAGFMNYWIGQPEKAVSLFTQALEEGVTPTDAVYFNRALAYMELNEADLWQADLEQVLAESENLYFISEAEHLLAQSGGTEQEADGRFRYTHEDFGYSFTFGEMWQREVADGSSGSDIVLTYETDEGWAYMDVTTFVEDTLFSYPELMDIVSSSIGSQPNVTILSVETVFVNGREGRLITYELISEDEDGEEILILGRQYYFIEDLVIVVITLEARDHVVPEINPELETLIDSFTWQP